MASIVDVAKKANVSIATVSRTLNNDSSVAPATARKVREAARELGYVQRAVRPGPKPSRRKGVNTGVIAFLAIGPYDPIQMYSMPIMSALFGGIQRGVTRHGMELVMAHMPDEKSLPSVLARRRADGIIVFCEEHLDFSLQNILQDTPAVWCLRGSFDTSNEYDHVLYDNAKVGQMAADYLARQGFRSWFFANTNTAHPAYSIRREAFLRAAAGYGIQPTSVEADNDQDPSVRIKLAEELVEKMVGGSEKAGVFCASDDLLLSVYNKLHQRGIEPDKDVGLIGCNNDPAMMAQMHPRPATIDIKLDAVGERAMDQLFWRMSNRDDHNQVELFITPELIPAEVVAV